MSDNPLEDTPEIQERIRLRAYHLWEADGRPAGQDIEYWERARELIGMEDSAGAGQMPPDRKTDVVEEASIQQNLGEFPDRLSDQGEHPSTPHPALRGAP